MKFADSRGGLHHPAQLYDAAMNIGVMFILLAVEKRKIVPGRIAALCLVLHGLARFTYEFWR
ncbi:prolipoprotein diacylglyceryl transferase family protein, partial [Staphylococcus aureus]